MTSARGRNWPFLVSRNRVDNNNRHAAAFFYSRRQRLFYLYNCGKTFLKYSFSWRKNQFFDIKKLCTSLEIINEILCTIVFFIHYFNCYVQEAYCPLEWGHDQVSSMGLSSRRCVREDMDLRMFHALDVLGSKCCRCFVP